MKPWEKYQDSGKPWEKFQSQGAVTATPRYSRENPAPGATLAPDEQLEAMMYDIPPEEYGYQARANIAMENAAAAAEKGGFNPRYADIPTGIPIPTNMDALALTGQAAGRGVADLVGMVGDIPAMAINAISGLADYPIEAAGFAPTAKFDQPLLGSESLAEIFGSLAEQAGYPVQDPASLEGVDKYGYNMTRFGTGGMVGGMGLAGKAARTTERGAELGPITSQYSGKANAARQVLDDTIMGMGAGAGTTAAEDMGGEELGQFAGAMLGGAGASVGSRVAQDAVMMTPRAIANRIPSTLPGGEVVDRRTLKDSSRLMQNLASDPKKASENIKAANQLADEGGMTRLTSGMAADDVGLGSVEVGKRTETPIPYMERDQAIRTDVTKSVSDMVDENADIQAPQNLARQEAARLKQDVTKISDEAQMKLSQKELEKQGLQGEIDETVRPITAERGNKAAASEQLDEQFDLAKEERGSAVGEAYAAAQKGKTVSVDPVSDSIVKINNSINELSFENSGVPKEFANKIKKLATDIETQNSSVLDGTGRPFTKEVNVGGKGVVSAEDLGKIRGNISDAADRATRAGNKDLAANLRQLKVDISKTLGDQIPEMKLADKKYAETYAPFFKEGVGGKVAGLKRKATDSAPYKPSETAKFFLDGSPEAAKDLKRIVDIAPDRKAAESAVERYMTANLAVKLGNKPSPKAVANFIADNSAQLDEFPAIKDKFVQLQKTMDTQAGKSNEMKIEIDRLHNEFKRAEGDILKTERRINKGVLGTLINNDPDRYVKNIMKGDDRLQKLDEVNKLIGNNKEAKEGLKRAVTEHLLDTVTGTNVKAVDSGDGPILYAQIAKVMKNNEDALAKVYSPKEMSALRRAQKILGSYGNLARRSTSGSDTAQKTRHEGLFTALETAFRVKYGVLKAGGVMKTLKGAARLLPEGRAAKAERIVSQAMLDPELAIHLLDTPVKQVGTLAWNKRLNQLLAAGAAARENVEEDDDEN